MKVVLMGGIIPASTWMLYHLQGDMEAASVFVGENAEILTNSGWQDVEKNK